MQFAGGKCLVRIGSILVVISLQFLMLPSVFAVNKDLLACAEMVKNGFIEVPEERADRFNGKVDEATARCRGGEKAVKYRHTPWVDWSNYWATGDTSSKHDGPEAKTLLGDHLKPNGRGIDGSLLDLEYQRIELIKFNLFDNHTYQTYVTGKGGKAGPAVTVWDEMRLPAEHAEFEAVGGEDQQQLCRGELIRGRTLTGICNDIYNPLMGSTGTEFARNVQFEETFPREGLTEITRNRHGDRLNLLTPDPQLISQKLFTRIKAANSDLCHQGQGLPNYAVNADCDYQKAPFFNVMAAFWIQFMTHDWLTHMKEGSNQVVDSPSDLMPVGCEDESQGCRPGDRIEPALIKRSGMPETFEYEGKQHWSRAFKTTQNFNTAWWDASQLYGYDALSQQRVLRDPEDAAKLWQPDGLLPTMQACSADVADQCLPMPAQWSGQEAAAFPDNWNIGLSFLHNVFVREHNSFVAAFRQMQKEQPAADSGLRTPDAPKEKIPYRAVTDEEIFQAARLVVSAMIAKIHTIEWTPQLLYGEPLYRGMNANWFGLFDAEQQNKAFNIVSRAVKKVTGQERSALERFSDTLSGWFARSDKDSANSWYSVFASGAGIFGLGNEVRGGLFRNKDVWDITNPAHVNGGVNHFGSPFNFPEEFMTVYRLHSLVPDLMEYREVADPNAIVNKIPVLDTVRASATEQMQARGLANWGLTMGRQRLGLLHLQNHPQFLQNLPMPHIPSDTQTIDVAALDLVRDRERGIPRFNEFRRQIGLRTLTSFDDFVDQRLPEGSKARQAQAEIVDIIREIYGTHTCDVSKVISLSQKDQNGAFINDCLGHPDGSVVDNIEDVDTVVGWLAEYTRPHGFAISETQFHVFIINASRRLFSDRFFTSSFRPEFYSQLGVDWVNQNGPLSDCPYPLEKTANGQKACLEPELVNAHKISVMPMKRVLMRNIPELREELLMVENAFDPWARERGEYYSIDWQPRAGAETDPAFQ